MKKLYQLFLNLLYSSYMTKARGIQSIEVGFRLLEVLEHAPGPTSLKVLAEKAKMSATNAHYYLTSFARVGLIVQKVPGGHYDLGPGAIRLGLAAMEHLDVLGLARDAMFEVRDATSEAVFLSVWGNRAPTIVHRVKGTYLSPLAIRVGSVLSPLSATGRAILSTLGPVAIRGIVEAAIADASPTDPWHGGTVEGVMPLIDEVRRDGVARGWRTVMAESGFVGLAAPIFSFEGNAQAALCINGRSDGFDMRQDGPNVRALLEATEKISQLAGARRAARSAHSAECR